MLDRFRQWYWNRKLARTVARQLARNAEHARFRERSLKGWQTRRGA